jgi:hypothetical protein
VKRNHFPKRPRGDVLYACELAAIEIKGQNTAAFSRKSLHRGKTDSARRARNNDCSPFQAKCS